MDRPEYITGDNDCIEMTRQNRDCYPGGEQLILMNREQAKELVEKASGKRVLTKAEVIMQLAQVGAPVFIGATWLLGAAEGLADPVFAGISVAICGLWAAVNFKWGCMNG